MTRSVNDRYLSIPANQLYWAVLDTAAIPDGRTRGRGRGRSPEQLGWLFERYLPLPIEQVHAVYVPVESTRILACGIGRDRLDRLPGRATALTLRPDTTEIRIPGVANSALAGRMNLLIGPYEAPPVRRLRRHCTALAATFVALFIVVVCAGLQRRLRIVERSIEETSAAQAEMRAQALALADGADESATGGSATQPIELRFLAQLRTLQRTRREGPASARSDDLLDISAPLTALLASWPSSEDDGLYIQSQSLSITPTGIVLRVAAPDSDDIRRLAESLDELQGWRLAQPEIQRGREGVQATLRFLPHVSASSAGQSSP